MSRYLAYMKAADMNIFEIAKVVEVDVLEVSMAVNNIGLANFDVVASIANALSCEVADLYPEIAETIEIIDEEGKTEGEARQLMTSEEHARNLMSVGIDPDLDRPFAIIRLKSGNERRYRMCSIERDKLQTAVADAKDTNGFFVFQADCRAVVVRKASIADVVFRDQASYARFSTEENGDRITVVFSDFARPEDIIVPPDQIEDDCHPLTDIVEAALDGEVLRPFINIKEDGDDMYVSIDRMELMEIPLGLITPRLYEMPVEPPVEEAPVELKDMTPMGNA